MNFCEKCFESGQVCWACRGQGASGRSAGSSKPRKVAHSRSVSQRQSVNSGAKPPKIPSSEPTQDNEDKVDAPTRPRQKEAKPKKTALPQQQCPLCNSSVVSTRLENHIKNKCPARQKRAIQMIRLKIEMIRLGTEMKEAPKQDKHACQNCGIIMSSSDLVNHMKQGCDSRRIESVNIDQNASSVAYRKSDEDIATAAFRQEFSDDYDATKGQGRIFRENGAFGSYPSHDNFDDESSS